MYTQTSVPDWNCSLILTVICSLLSQCLFRSFTSIGSMPFHTITTDSSSDSTHTEIRTEERLPSSQQTHKFQPHRPDFSPAGVYDPKPTPRFSSLVFLFMTKKKWLVSWSISTRKSQHWITEWLESYGNIIFNMENHIEENTNLLSASHCIIYHTFYTKDIVLFTF